jgi:hypothetical protein
MNYYETKIHVRRWKDGKQQASFADFDLASQAQEYADRMATSAGVEIIHCPWNARIADLKPIDAVVVEEVRIRNPYTAPQRVYALT